MTDTRSLLEVARLLGRLRAARHSFRELREHPRTEVRSAAVHTDSCDLCCRRITPGRAMLSWLWGVESGAIVHVTVHPDCLRVYDSWSGEGRWGSDMWDEIVAGHHGLTQAALMAEIDACEDPDVAATLRERLAERVEHGWDEVTDGP